MFEFTETLESTQKDLYLNVEFYRNQPSLIVNVTSGKETQRNMTRRHIIRENETQELGSHLSKN
jgi:hypothetical protein